MTQISTCQRQHPGHLAWGFGLAAGGFVLVALLMVHPLAPLVATLTVGAVVVCFLWPAVLWIGMLAALPFSVEISALLAGINITIPTEALVPLIVAIMLGRWLVTGRFLYPTTPLNALVALNVLVLALSTLGAGDWSVTLKTLFKTCGYILAGYLFTFQALRSRSTLRWLLGIGAVTYTALVLYGFWTQRVGGLDIYQVIAYPFFRNHCVYAAMLCFPLAVSLAFSIEYTTSRWRLIALVMTGLLSLGIVLTFVRGAWLSVLALGAWYAWRFRNKLKIHTVVLVILLVALLFGIVASLGVGDLFTKRWETAFDPNYVSNYSRLDRWLAALAMVRNHPLLGVGTGMYYERYFEYVAYTDSFERDIRMGAHNIYLQSLAETGLLGFGAFVALILAFFHECRRARAVCQHDKFYWTWLVALEGAMVCYLVHGMVDNLSPSDKIEVRFWVVLAMAVAIKLLGEKETIRQTAMDQ